MADHWAVYKTMIGKEEHTISIRLGSDKDLAEAAIEILQRMSAVTVNGVRVEKEIKLSDSFQKCPARGCEHGG